MLWQRKKMIGRVFMHYRKLGNTGLLVSEISFGTIPVLQGKYSGASTVL